MKITYSAWLVDSLGTAEETIDLPADVTTVGQLIDWLGRRGGRYEEAFEFIEVVKVSVNHRYVGYDHAVTDADAVMLFPPIAGG